MNITWGGYSDNYPKHSQTFTKIDMQILVLEKKIRETYREMNRLPNSPIRLKLYNKMEQLRKKQGQLVYSHGGWQNFSHLLRNGSIKDELVEEV
ncbi:hypothetical protein [Thermoanaerobacter sp. YS13]|uniref:hypothetical protein n=1 Tax=Thermoanaerobacter sp. YS13 TaxID=1511746 RepID=UPI0005B2F93B|nr:hypothetical protein [Thermoanaerobacter sp. YS13]